MPRAGIQPAQPGLRFLPAHFSPWVHRLSRWALPVLLRTRGIVDVQVEGAERLAQLFAEHQQGRARLLIAFRHPTTTDPLTMAQLVWEEVPRAARAARLRLHRPVYSQFLYDRGIPLWAGAAAGWILGALGGIPIQRGKLDRVALKAARDVLAEGSSPLAIAPEGATNNHGEMLGPLEPGLAQLAFWCCDDLAAAGRQQRVLIVPIALRYVTQGLDWPAVDALLDRLEAQLGRSPGPEGAGGSRGGGRPAEERRYRRLIQLGEGVITVMEDFYRQAHGLELPPLPAPAPGTAANEHGFIARLERIRNAALAVAETHLQLLRPKGSLGERCRRVEQAGWSRLYRDDLETMTPLERSLADWQATEARLAMDHMRLVEHFSTLSGSYVAEKPSFDRYTEVLQILWRAIAWINGTSHDKPPDLGSRLARLSVGEPIDVTERHGRYLSGRREAVNDLMAELRARMLAELEGAGPGAQAARAGLGTSSA
ncbi:1-acyl-sn-glycerol-3-phosphate acyltransferase [Synechococcus sp. ATX 2A4]|uniref:lysophospholipid acyltransferase family protein n=1 Tax=Synechococcus sp. ATX 2A4 TaxID=2823727 RepID=UPI0020CD8159|nr:1-acyl-sn-glycerol-3-phosphate acyltransferase [Synechococcus sp. ATX 2A4]MCP9884282.1 1-acyl-sn-glycerol-3-phosphate acyltransferase [Synechococcus sp. ATX 2A4]